MADYNTGPNFVFEMENMRSEGARQHQLVWAERVFAEPRLLGQSFDVRLFDAARLTIEQEAQLYNDFQGRDSELGMGLVNWRKAELAEVITVVRTAVAKRYLTISLTRTRIDAIEKINQAEPNPKLRYSEQAIDELRKEAERANSELTYLRARISQMHALEHLLRVLYNEGPQISSRSTEQLLRSLGQSWRGILRVRAWADQFRTVDNELLNTLPAFSFSRNIQGYLLKLGKESKPVVIARDTARYLFHMLASINFLAEATAQALQQPERLNENNWYPVSTLLRAIVEFFHVCNFELPIFHLNVAVDVDDPAHVYEQDDAGWHTIKDDMGVAATLKRVAAEAALLLAEASPLLDCTDMDRLDRFLKYEANNAPTIDQVDGRDVQPYSSCGLSEFDLDPAGQRVKFRTAFPLMSALIDLLVKGNKDLKRLRGSALGGPFETIIGMASLDPKAFDLPPNTINSLDRFRFLSQFWRAVGRRRAIGMLGEDYVRNISAGLQALGQPGPDHPTFLTMKVPAVVVGREQMISSIAGPEALEKDALPGLSVEDQMRIIDLINISWALADDFMVQLREMSNEADLKDLVAEFPRMVDSYRSELVKRFSDNWIGSMNWVWSMIRGLSPMLWDFWSKVGAERSWDEMISRAPAAAATGLLLRLFCDSVRLVLLLETSGSTLAGGLRVSAESASQNIMLGIERFLFGQSVPSVIGESIDYYYDPNIQFDSWLAFVSSYKTYIKRSIKDLKRMNAVAEHWQLLETIYNELERMYPTRVMASPPPKVRATKEYPVGLFDEPKQVDDKLRLITEEEAQLFKRVCFDLLAVSEFDHTLYLQLLTLFRSADTKDLIHQGARYQSAIEQLLVIDHRRLLYTLPGRADSFFRLMAKLESENRLDSRSLTEMRGQVNDYFEQLKETFNNTRDRLILPCPRILPRENVDQLCARFNEKRSQERSKHIFFLLSVGSETMLFIDDWNVDDLQEEAKVVQRVRNTMSAIVGSDIDDPFLEIYVLGGGELTITSDRIYIYGSNRLCEPAFSEYYQPTSQMLLSNYVRTKLLMTQELLRARFYLFNKTFVVQP